MKDLKQAPSIQKIEKFINQQDFLVLTGYLGTSNDKSKSRIYFNKTSLESFIEIDSIKILDFEQNDKNDEWLTKFIIDSEAKIVFSKIGRLKEIFGDAEKCSCQHDEDEPNLLGKKRNPRQNDNLELACRLNCLLAREACMDKLLSEGKSEAEALTACNYVELACNAGCIGSRI
jgi:hypothetical protein